MSDDVAEGGPCLEGGVPPRGSNPRPASPLPGAADSQGGGGRGLGGLSRATTYRLIERYRDTRTVEVLRERQRGWPKGRLRDDLQGWQWLFLIEAVPAVVLSAIVFFTRTDGPADAHWLSPAPRGTWRGQFLPAGVPLLQV